MEINIERDITKIQTELKWLKKRYEYLLYEMTKLKEKLEKGVGGRYRDTVQTHTMPP